MNDPETLKRIRMSCQITKYWKKKKFKLLWIWKYYLRHFLNVSRMFSINLIDRKNFENIYICFSISNLELPKNISANSKPKEGYWQQTKIAIKSVMWQIGKYRKINIVNTTKRFSVNSTYHTINIRFCWIIQY